ncbi:MAG: hypothetical protein LBS71_01340 [Puniceicoccales bacterium]|jgi:hypothetical protein|nr:hypothetical protein [Puniceicoccales bacterium]
MKLCEKLRKINDFCYYFYRIAIRFILIRMPLFLTYLLFALLINAFRKPKPGESR